MGVGWCTRTRAWLRMSPMRHVGHMRFTLWFASTVPACSSASPTELRGLAESLQAIVRAYDAMFARPFPYVMVVHQAPTDGHSQGHLHVEFYPPLRTAEKLKYPAGSEQGAGTFIGDTLPEDSAQALREAIAHVI